MGIIRLVIGEHNLRCRGGFERYPPFALLCSLVSYSVAANSRSSGNTTKILLYNLDVLVRINSSNEAQHHITRYIKSTSKLIEARCS